MPHNTEAEKATISAILMDPESLYTAMEVVTGDDFYGAQYGTMFDALKELNEEGKQIDIISFQERLKAKGMPENATGIDRLSELLEYASVSVNIRQNVQIIKEKSILRKLISANDAVNNMCYAGTTKLDTVINEAEKAVFSISQNRSNSDYVPIRQIVINAIDKINEASSFSGKITGIPTGFIDLDRQTSGMQPSDLIIVAARPSMGKTAFVLNIAEHVAFKKKKAVAIFSLEMSKEQLVNRIFSLESGIDAQAIRTGNLKSDEWARLIESADEIAKSQLIIDDTSGISISELRSKCRKFKMEHDIQMIIIDYIQLMSGSKRSGESRQNEIAEISRALKTLARELNVPVIALSQLSRAVERRDDKRPMMSDLRESGGIEQDADVIMFIYRDEYYTKQECKEPGVAEIIVAKQRNGPVGTVKLAWLGNLTKFANKEREMPKSEG